MKHILLVSGTRPEIVKLAPVYHALRAARWATVQWLHTGQHDEMATQILSCFDIVPDLSLRRQGTTIADFGVGQEVGLVLVRIVDELSVEIRLESPTAVSFEPPVVACLVGPDAAPDDAGLEDSCWAVAEVGPLLEAQLSHDAGGRLQLPANAQVTVHATLRRGGAGCDYPPGSWHLELLVDPILAGEPAGPRYAPHASFEIGYDPGEVLQVVDERRYCGLASKVYREQGEPAITGN